MNLLNKAFIVLFVFAFFLIPVFGQGVDALEQRQQDFDLNQFLQLLDKKAVYTGNKGGIYFLDLPREEMKSLAEADFKIIGYTDLNNTIQINKKKEGANIQLLYLVQPGDSLYLLAVRYNTTIAVIKEVNNLQSDQIYVGQELIIPDNPELPDNPDSPDNPENPGNQIYYVQAGDSLYKLSLKYKTTIEAIKVANKLQSDILYVGQKLVIPDSESSKPDNPDNPDTPENPDQQIYYVQAGDSLYKIALNYNTTIAAIKELNKLQSDFLFVGQRLIIPAAGQDTPDNDTPDSGAPDIEAPLVYFVQPGDSLYLIAQKYEVAVEELKTNNNLSSNSLYVDQMIYITPPPLELSWLSYLVQAGDTLNILAERFYTGIEEIMIVNNLQTEFINEGQSLIFKLPAKEEIRADIVLEYQVEGYDNLNVIAAKFDLSPWEIRIYNSLRFNIVEIGQVIEIPLAVPSLERRSERVVTAEEMELLTRAVYSEARGEPFIGQVAVAEVILNRVDHTFFPQTIKEVIFQPYQFSAVDDGQFWLEPDQIAALAVKAALQGWDPTQGAIYYYNPDTATSDWVFYRNVIVKIGNHYFAV